MVALVTLTHSVRVQILFPQPRRSKLYIACSVFLLFIFVYYLYITAKEGGIKPPSIINALYDELLYGAVGQMQHNNFVSTFL